LGVLVLTSVPVNTLKLILAIFVLAAAGLLSLGWKLKARANNVGTFGVGVASGIVNGSIGMGGLPVALFLTADGDSPSKIRAAVVAYFFLLDMLGLILFRILELSALKRCQSPQWHFLFYSWVCILEHGIF